LRPVATPWTQVQGRRLRNGIDRVRVRHSRHAIDTHPGHPAGSPIHRLGVGTGVVSFARPGTCTVRTTAESMTIMAGQSAAQRGPCLFARHLRLVATTGRDGTVVA
jgi:hypothetical protein